VEISTHDLEATLRTLLEAKVPLTNLRIRPANLEDLFLELTGTELRHDQAAAVGAARAQPGIPARTAARWCSRCCCVMLVIGMGFVFGGPERPLFKVGVLAGHPDRQAHPFLRERYVEFITLADESAALRKLTHQQIDLLVDLHAPPRYWVNTDSPKGYIRGGSCCSPLSRPRSASRSPAPRSAMSTGCFRAFWA